MSQTLHLSLAILEAVLACVGGLIMLIMAWWLLATVLARSLTGWRQDADWQPWHDRSAPEDDDAQHQAQQ